MNPAPDVPDTLGAIARVIGEDERLRQWFHHIATAPDDIRVSAVGRLTSQMTAGGEDAKIIAAFRLLTDGPTCRAVQQVIYDRYGPMK
jgi:hypothetical protein